MFREPRQLRQLGELGDIGSDVATLISEAPAVLSSLATIVRKGKPYIATLRSVVDDPALPAVMDRIKIIAEIEASSPGLPTFPGTTPKPPTAPTPGIGLHYFVKPLDAYIYARRNPMIAVLLGAGFLILVGGIGYKLGQNKAKGGSA